VLAQLGELLDRFDAAVLIGNKRSDRAQGRDAAAGGADGRAGVGDELRAAAQATLEPRDTCYSSGENLRSVSPGSAARRQHPHCDDGVDPDAGGCGGDGGVSGKLARELSIADSRLRFHSGQLFTLFEASSSDFLSHPLSELIGILLRLESTVLQSSFLSIGPLANPQTRSRI
jgi:hypothetical protein